MIRLAQFSGTAFIGGGLALSFLAETKSAEGPDCTRWVMAFIALAILTTFLLIIVAWLLLRVRSVGIRWIGTIVLVYLSGSSMSLVVHFLGIEFSVPGVGWYGAIVALAAIGAIAFLGWLQRPQAVSDPLVEHIDVVFDGFSEGKTIQEMADSLRVPKTQITTIYWCISKINRRLD